MQPELLNLFLNVKEMAATAGVDDSVDIVDEIRTIARANQRFDESCELAARRALEELDPSLTPAEREQEEAAVREIIRETHEYAVETSHESMKRSF